MPPTKVRIEKIESQRVRQHTFLKRKGGLLKKAMELTILCDCDVAVIINKKQASSNARSARLVAYSNRDVKEMITECWDDLEKVVQVTNAVYPKGGKCGDADDAPGCFDDEEEAEEEVEKSAPPARNVRACNHPHGSLGMAAREAAGLALGSGDRKMGSPIDATAALSTGMNGPRMGVPMQRAQRDMPNARAPCQDAQGGLGMGGVATRNSDGFVKAEGGGGAYMDMLQQRQQQMVMQHHQMLQQRELHQQGAGMGFVNAGFVPGQHEQQLPSGRPQHHVRPYPAARDGQVSMDDPDAWGSPAVYNSVHHHHQQQQQQQQHHQEEQLAAQQAPKAMMGGDACAFTKHHAQGIADPQAFAHVGTAPVHNPFASDWEDFAGAPTIPTSPTRFAQGPFPMRGMQQSFDSATW
mmetsp:Transcript_44579/g.111717  ORF Transcript_44579/g.111717 Transcript_44579/m.111717 type:complete len:409 (+) Transcript_44579:88-1314(+)